MKQQLDVFVFFFVLFLKLSSEMVFVDVSSLILKISKKRFVRYKGF